MWCVIKRFFSLYCLKKCIVMTKHNRNLESCIQKSLANSIYRGNACTTVIISRECLVFKTWTKGSVEITSKFNSKNLLNCLRITKMSPLKEITWHHIWCHCCGMLPTAKLDLTWVAFRNSQKNCYSDYLWSITSLSSTPWQEYYFMCNNISSSLNLCHKLEDPIGGMENRDI